MQVWNFSTGACLKELAAVSNQEITSIICLTVGLLGSPCLPLMLAAHHHHHQIWTGRVAFTESCTSILWQVYSAERQHVGAPSK